MEWVEDKDRSRVFYRASASGNSDQALAEAFADVRRKLAADVLPKHAPTDWDCLRVEFWSDSGRLILYPGRVHNPARNEKAGCELQVKALLGFWENLADADITDDDFGRRVRTEQRRYAALLLKTWTPEASPPPSGQPTVKILFFEAEEPTPFLEANVPAFALRSH